MELCDYSLEDQIAEARERHEEFDEYWIWNTLKLLCDALVYLHGTNVIHRDIKPQNILFKNNMPKLCDFGLSHILGDDSFASSDVGTTGYRAPEPETSRSSDMYALGATFYKVIALVPWDRNNPSPYPQSFSNALVELISRLLDDDPKLRPEAFEVLDIARQHTTANHQKESESLNRDIATFQVKLQLHREQEERLKTEELSLRDRQEELAWQAALPKRKDSQ